RAARERARDGRRSGEPVADRPRRLQEERREPLLLGALAPLEERALAERSSADDAGRRGREVELEAAVEAHLDAVGHGDTAGEGEVAAERVAPARTGPAVEAAGSAHEAARPVGADEDSAAHDPAAGEPH